MFNLMNFPVILAVVSLLAMWLAGRIGCYIREKRMAKRGEPSSDFNLAVTATLTLLGLIIGFSFSMAMSRYDQRKNYEEAEANAIGTEYVRVDVLPAADAAKIKVFSRRTPICELRSIDPEIGINCSVSMPIQRKCKINCGALWKSLHPHSPLQSLPSPWRE